VLAGVAEIRVADTGNLVQLSDLSAHTRSSTRRVITYGARGAATCVSLVTSLSVRSDLLRTAVNGRALLYRTDERVRTDLVRRRLARVTLDETRGGRGHELTPADVTDGKK